MCGRFMKGKKTKNRMRKSNIFFETATLIKKSGLNFWLFELLYKLAAFAILYPLLLAAFGFTLKRAGFNYLTNDYIYIYLRNPFTILLILLLITGFISYVSMELCCLAICFDAAHHDRKISLLEIFRGGTRLFTKKFWGKKFFSGFGMVNILVTVNVTLIGFLVANVNLPSFVTDIFKRPVVLAGVILVLVALFIYCLVNIFVVNIVAYDGSSTKEARQRSRRMIRHRWWKTLLTFVLWNLFVLVLIYGIYFILLALIWIGVSILNKTQLGIAIYLAVFRNAIKVIKVLLFVGVLPVCFSIVSTLFYRFRCDSGNAENTGIFSKEGAKKSAKENRKLQVWIAGILIAVSVAADSYYLVKSFETNPFHNVEMFNDTEVMAHRGNSYNAPENTMLAFEKAVEATADYIEIDVHMTKDGRLVVMHDSNLKRTAGINREIYNVNYEDIRDADVGSWFGSDEEFAKCRIPLLSDVMKYAKNRIKLNIEVKQSDHEPGLVDKVVEMIHEFKFEDECVITSMNYEALKQAKMLDESIKTGYVLSVAYGSFYNIDYVDAFSINSGYVDKNVIDAIHNRGKEVYVWTINGEDRAKELTMMGVDAIITDNTEMAREVIYSKYSNGLLFNVLSYVFKK